MLRSKVPCTRSARAEKTEVESVKFSPVPTKFWNQPESALERGKESFGPFGKECQHFNVLVEIKKSCLFRPTTHDRTFSGGGWVSNNEDQEYVKKAKEERKTKARPKRKTKGCSTGGTERSLVSPGESRLGAWV